jgi:hypothetical protein
MLPKVEKQTAHAILSHSQIANLLNLTIKELGNKTNHSRLPHKNEEITAQ